MTDAMLRLARAVYPDRSACVGDVYAMFDGEICVLLENVVRVRDSGRPGGWAYFDPANNADQFCDLLVWLTGGDDAQYAAADFRDRYLRVWNRTNPGYFEIDHDGTASGIRAAVVEAALSVLKNP